MLQNTHRWSQISVEKELSVNSAKSTTAGVMVSQRAQLVHSLQSHSLNGAKNNKKFLNHQQSISRRQAVAEAEMCDQVCFYSAP